MAQVLRRLGFALFIAAGIVYLNYRITDSPLDWLTYLEASIPVILFMLVPYAGWLAVGSPAAQEWKSLESEFPNDRDSIQMPKLVANGAIWIGDDVAALRAIVYPDSRGIVIVQQANQSHKLRTVCIPWERIKHIIVRKPAGLERCATPDDYNRLERYLRAELVIFRGLFPPFKIGIPWRYLFESSL